MADKQIKPGRELVLAAIENAHTSDRLLKAAVERTFQPDLIKGKSPGALRRLSATLLDTVSPQHISHNVLRRIERNRLSVRRSISFKAKVHEMSEARNLGVLRPTWKLDAKNAAYSFVDAVGARRPKSDAKTYAFADLPIEFPSVIKATRSTGSRGCYLLMSPEKILHVRDNAQFSSIDEFKKHASKLMTTNTRPLPDKWMHEELILEDQAKGTPARNLKFYAFYGEIMLMQESRRDEGLEVTFWDAERHPTITGRYEDLNFNGVGFTPEDAEVVAKLSRAIPYPFVRIDMLNGQQERVLGEFTPRPGNFDQFNDEWDRKLGEAWVRAESRLMEDLLRGKQFSEFLTSTDLLE